jgi:hypothetical protein
MFDETAVRWIDEMLLEGKLKGLSQKELKLLRSDYARRLEKIFHEEVSKQLKPSGKVEEFERMLDYDSQYLNKYLNQTIPGYPGFKMDIFNSARKIITDEI